MVPTRADRCCYVLYRHDPTPPRKTTDKTKVMPYGTDQTIAQKDISDHMTMDDMLDYLLDPVTGSPAVNKTVEGIVCLHVDDLFFTGSKYFHEQVISHIRKGFEVGSEDKGDVMFTGQRIRWDGDVLVVDQDKAIEELTEVKFVKTLNPEGQCAVFS